jgi:hypothetical protein
MCDRFTLRSSAEAVAEAFGLPEVPDFLPRFNIAPGQPVAVVWQKQQAQGRELAFLRWGLIPAWADDPSLGDHLANVRSETAATKPPSAVPFNRGAAWSLRTVSTSGSAPTGTSSRSTGPGRIARRLVAPPTRPPLAAATPPSPRLSGCPVRRPIQGEPV